MSVIDGLSRYKKEVQHLKKLFTRSLLHPILTHSSTDKNNTRNKRVFYLKYDDCHIL